MTLNTVEDRPTVQSPADAAGMLHGIAEQCTEISTLDQEHLRVILQRVRVHV